MMLGKVIEYIKQPGKIYAYLAFKGCFNYLNDEKYCERLFKAETGRKLNLSNPKSFNEKLNWLKLNDRKPIYTTMVDKIKGKEYIEKVLGGGSTIVPTLKVWNSVEEVDISELPEQFVLKTNHDSDGYVICRNKSQFDLEKAKKVLKKSFQRNYYLFTREWPYNNVKKKVFAEKFLDMGEALIDYKVMCFNGIPEVIQVNYVSEKRHTQDFYDTDWKQLNISQNFYAPISDVGDAKPEFLEEMLKKSEILAKDTYFLRVDWFIAEGKLYSGELTLYDGAGIMPYDDYAMDLDLGARIKLPID